MEEDWNNRVDKALKLISSNVHDLNGSLKILFSDFKGISKKLKFIKDCRDQQNVLSMFNKFLSEEKYCSCFDLANKFEFLKELNDFKIIYLLEKSLFEQANEAIENGKWNRAKNYATQLLVFPNYTNKAKTILNQIDQTANFYTLLAKKSYPTMISLATRHDFLQKLPEYESAVDHVQNEIQKAESFVSKGGIVNILKIAQEYKKISNLIERFGKILSSAYIQQLYYVLRKYPKELDIVFKAMGIYVKIFGIDNNLLIYIAHIEENFSISLINLNEVDFSLAEYKENYLRWVDMKLPSRIFDIPKEVVPTQ
jgi:hypothetical protein